MTAQPPRAPLYALLAHALLTAVVGSSVPDPSWCEVPVRLHGGWVCGEQRRAGSGAEFASFLGVPYAKQPLGELRFQELQPLEPWDEPVNATREGPVCPQTDVLYKGLMQARGGMSEACIHANVHVPLSALPAPHQPPAADKLLPVLVFIHGGGFAFGSGDPDLHGPEYLVSKDVIVITFNYRLNVFGFLSLNSSFIPGNNGLRDCVAALRWVRDNAACFGGDPARVTVAGQSAGAALAQLLTLVPSAEGLFERVISLSGVATSDFFSSSAQFAGTAARLLLGLLGLDPALDARSLHARLINTPLAAILRANRVLIDLFGLSTFVPVVESLHPGVTPMLLEEPEVLLKRGAGKGVPLLLGFTDRECETFRPRFVEIDIEAKLEQMPSLFVTPRLTYKASPEQIPALTRSVQARYLNGSASVVDGFVEFCSDAMYKYPAFRVARQRADAGGAPVYMYRFSYGGQRSPIKGALGMHFPGAGHIEDLTYLFRANAYLGPVRAHRGYGEDDQVADWITDYVINFMISGSEDVSSWWEESAPGHYLSVEGAQPPVFRAPSLHEKDLQRFFDNLYAVAEE